MRVADVVAQATDEALRAAIARHDESRRAIAELGALGTEPWRVPTSDVDLRGLAQALRDALARPAAKKGKPEPAGAIEIQRLEAVEAPP